MTRRLTVVAIAIAMLVVPAAANAAKVKISGGNIAVNDNGVAAIKLSNPNRSRAKGTLRLRSGTVAIGSKGFNLAGHHKGTARVALSDPALQVLANGDAISATAYAAAKGKGTSSKHLVLFYPGASGGGGSTGGGGGGTAGWQDGRWQGTWATNNTNLAFNVTGNRLYTGPFDSFYIQATCHNVDPNYTGPNQTYTDSTAVEPIEATINPDGSFSGSGTYRPSADLAMPWTLSGHISGTRIGDGTFSVNYTDYYGNPCSATANFTANWYGAYTLKRALR